MDRDVEVDADVEVEVDSSVYFIFMVSNSRWKPYLLVLPPK